MGAVSLDGWRLMSLPRNLEDGRGGVEGSGEKADAVGFPT